MVQKKALVQISRQPVAPNRAMLLPLSARSPLSLKRMAQRWREFLTSLEEEQRCLQDLCYSASQQDEHHEYRLALLGRTHLEMVDAVGAFLSDTRSPSVHYAYHTPHDKHKLVFVFSGHGSHWIGMGRQLLAQEPVFRFALEQCELALCQYVEWSLLGVVSGSTGQEYLNDSYCVHLVKFAIQVALAALWRSWGITPDAIVGHSTGEAAAAHAAGILSLEDAAKISCHSGQLMKPLKGRMAVIGLPMDEAQLALEGYGDRVAVAASNSPKTTIISGDPIALEEALTPLRLRGTLCRYVNIDVAGHSPQVDVLRDDLYRLLADIQPREATIPLFSPVTNTAVHVPHVEGDPQLDAAYWFRNLREPVLFSSTIERLLADSYDVFVEISPHPVLRHAIQQCMQHVARKGNVFSSLRRDADERTELLETLGGLYKLNFPVDWNVLYPEGGFIATPSTVDWQD